MLEYRLMKPPQRQWGSLNLLHYVPTYSPAPWYHSISLIRGFVTVYGTCLACRDEAKVLRWPTNVMRDDAARIQASPQPRRRFLKAPGGNPQVSDRPDSDVLIEWACQVTLLARQSLISHRAKYTQLNII